VWSNTILGRGRPGTTDLVDKAAMTYSVKEIFYTLQGEGANSGSPAVFCRFAGCNLWSGREEDRTTAICRFCDTDFVGTNGEGGGKFDSPDALASAILAKWPSPDASRRFVVFTGGEPALQLDEPLLEAVHARKFRIAIETNGTLKLPLGLDWVCVSPKAGTELATRIGDELKLVYPQAGASPTMYETLQFKHFFLSPMDGPERGRNTALAIQYCQGHPQWRLSLQVHKIVGIP
jgi:7-carboxy-7-deazaguanine synthase